MFAPGWRPKTFTYLSNFRPVLCLPSKEYSIAVRFSPVKYKLRHWPAVEKKQEGSVDGSGGASSKGKPWEENKTLFALPYRMVYAVATLNSVVLYDTQQEEAFARVSQIHYIGLTDLTWYVKILSALQRGRKKIFHKIPRGAPKRCFTSRT